MVTSSAMAVRAWIVCVAWRDRAPAAHRPCSQAGDCPGAVLFWQFVSAFRGWSV